MVHKKVGTVHALLIVTRKSQPSQLTLFVIHFTKTMTPTDIITVGFFLPKIQPITNSSYLTTALSSLSPFTKVVRC
ncbi:hypothetical protein A3K86_05865 [Photobacterium jeanii]|uniref:Uncharacterized protein n=1 Tax=Photobacterium jeanii TaxID=858640 RepID=A0A178KN57_9GAMM|nr:hypothetical protein A3K86_05865 [Photobacterium jeanii]PST91904.1 hypothetical protein C9I91_01605 [Photobacterium jeanii]